jgi:hypothetical protein
LLFFRNKQDICWSCKGSKYRSGYFVFLDAPEGHVDILAENNRGEPMVIQGFVAAQEMTTYLELATTDKTNRTVLRSYDALTGEPQKASVEFPAQDPPLELNGEAKQVMASIDQWQETYVRPENPTYADAFYQYNQAEDHIHFPLMTKAWLNNFLVEMDVVPQGSVLGVDGAGASGSVNPAPTPLATRANRTIGFVTDEEFTVYIAGHPELRRFTLMLKANDCKALAVRLVAGLRSLVCQRDHNKLL